LSKSLLTLQGTEKVRGCFPTALHSEQPCRCLSREHVVGIVVKHGSEKPAHSGVPATRQTNDRLVTNVLVSISQTSSERVPNFRFSASDC
jgi:hypothetical protein